MDGEKVGPKIRSRQCMFVLYPESQQAAIDYAQKYLPCAWALHDKDVYEKDAEDGSHKKGDLKKPHIHFVCKFKSARWFTAIAKELGVPVNTIRKVNNLYKAYVYLWHMLDPDKYQYSQDIVGMNEGFEVPSDHAGMSAAEDEQVQILLDMPPDIQSFNALARWAYENGCWAAFKRNYAMWRDIFVEQKQANRYSPKPSDRPLDRFNTLDPDVPDPF